MATAALESRDTCGEKLGDSVRQLRSYLTKPTIVERILLQKVEKVDIDREELIAKHHLYAKKAGKALTEETMKKYIEEKIDDAVDAVDEGHAKIDELREIKKKKEEEENVLQIKQNRLLSLHH